MGYKRTTQSYGVSQITSVGIWQNMWFIQISNINIILEDMAKSHSKIQGSSGNENFCRTRQIIDDCLLSAVGNNILSIFIMEVQLDESVLIQITFWFME